MDETELEIIYRIIIEKLNQIPNLPRSRLTFDQFREFVEENLCLYGMPTVVDEDD